MYAQDGSELHRVMNACLLYTSEIGFRAGYKINECKCFDSNGQHSIELVFDNVPITRIAGSVPCDRVDQRRKQEVILDVRSRNSKVTGNH